MRCLPLCVHDRDIEIWAALSAESFITSLTPGWLQVSEYIENLLLSMMSTQANWAYIMQSLCHKICNKASIFVIIPWSELKPKTNFITTLCRWELQCRKYPTFSMRLDSNEIVFVSPCYFPIGNFENYFHNLGYAVSLFTTLTPLNKQFL